MIKSCVILNNNLTLMYFIPVTKDMYFQIHEFEQR